MSDVARSPGAPIRIKLLPLGEELSVPRGTPLQDFLFAHGVEFPCGGRGRCKGCKVKILTGALPVTAEDQQKLTPSELAAGWRLACRATATGNLTLELAQWDAAILSDDSVFAFAPREGLGVAVDLGTTTIVAQLIDLRTGHVLGVRAALNEQARHGADIMSRVEFAVAGKGQPTLETLVRGQIGRLVEELLATARAETAPGTGISASLKSVVVVGNTVMHHLFSGLSVEPLSHVPFEPASPGLQVFRANELGWSLPSNPIVHFLPCLGGFVGSDILAGVLATQLAESDSLAALVDLGTNGELVVGNRHGLLCASTAAGPAFEGARISTGMRAATGAISEVHAVDGRIACHVVGNGPARGVCGSGLVDAVATGLELDLIRPNGRLAQGDALPLTAEISLTQWDIRELQLAKGAIAAGLKLLLEQWGATTKDLTRIHLAGAFGNYINQASARRIGLLDVPSDKLRASGNTALLGAKLALFSLPEHHGAYPDILRKIKHVPLNEDERFQEAFVAEMGFPASSSISQTNN